jgi:plasmid stabilization system protein ParE
VKKRLRASRRIWLQLDRASRWWRRNREKAPDAFDLDIAAALDRISTHSDIGTPVRSRRGGVRSLWLERIGYFLYYRVVNDDTIEILSVWHAARGSRPRF